MYVCTAGFYWQYLISVPYGVPLTFAITWTCCSRFSANLKRCLALHIPVQSLMFFCRDICFIPILVWPSILPFIISCRILHQSILRTSPRYDNLIVLNHSQTTFALPYTALLVCITVQGILNILLCKHISMLPDYYSYSLSYI